MNYKKSVITTLCTIAFFLMGIGAFMVWIDPYQQYHANPTYCGNQRSEIAGVARHHDYDAIITGSSMAMNHYPQQADSLWGWKTKNFSIMGATDDDYATILPFVIAQGKAVNVIIGIDFFSFARRRGAVPIHLYDNNLFNDYLYLWNYKSLETAVKFAMSGGVHEEGLYHFNSPFGRQHLLDDFKAHIDLGYGDQMGGGELFDYQQCSSRFDESVLKIIKESPEVNWYVYFPPYSIAEFVIYSMHDNLETNLRLRQHMADSLSVLPNVTMYDFQRSPWIDNLDQYMDLRHHSHEYNRAILRAIHDGQYLATPDTVRNNSLEIKQLVNQYKDSLLAL